MRTDHQNALHRRLAGARRLLAVAAAAIALAASPAPAVADDAATIQMLADHIVEFPSTPYASLAGSGIRSATIPELRSAGAGVSTLADEVLPAQFDLRDYNGMSYVTAVRNQNNYGNCWAFADTGALESNLALRNAAAPSHLSVNFLSYFAATAYPESTAALLGAAGQGGEGIVVDDGVSPYDLGGGPLVSATVAMNSLGIPSDESVPLRDAETVGTDYATVEEADRTDLSNRAVSVDAAYLLPSTNIIGYNSATDKIEHRGEDLGAIDTIKRALMDTGAISVSFCANEDPAAYNRETFAFYNSEYQALNHGVLLVGWDDTYSADNFATKPPADGAWLCRNSWGSTSVPEVDPDYYDWGIDGGSGYFWISYYDQSITDPEVFEAGEPFDADTDVVMQYDLLGDTGALVGTGYFDTPVSAANVFTASDDMTITEVTALTKGAASATVDIYLLEDGATDPTDGAHVLSQQEELPGYGLYTIDLNEPVAVQQGQRFAVVEQIYLGQFDLGAGPQELWYLPLETGVCQEMSVEWKTDYHASAVINEGETYVCLPDDATGAAVWADAQVVSDNADLTKGQAVFGNACIKVFGEKADRADGGTIDIVHVNDTHGRHLVEWEDEAGNECTVNAYSALKQVAEQTDAALVLDAGDTFHGDAFATVSEGASIAQLMDAAGVDATTPGNHDCSYGADRLAELDGESGFSVLAANVVDAATGEPYFGTPYILREAELKDDTGAGTGTTVTVGVFGVTDEDFYISTPAANVEGLAFTDPVEAAAQTAAELRAAGADVVICLTHMADPVAFAGKLSGVDAVIAGHDHLEISQTVTAADGRAVAVAECASSPSADYFGQVGVLTLELEASTARDAGAWQVTGGRSETVPVADEAFIQTDPAVAELTATLEAEALALLDQVVGLSSKDYPYPASSTTAPGGWELTRTEDTPIGHVVTGSYLAQTGADLAFENAGGIRGGIAAGDVTAGDLVSILPYGNTIATYRLAGAQIRDTLERSLALQADCREVLSKQLDAVAAGEDPMQYSWPSGNGSVIVFGGATVQIDWARPDGERIVSIEVAGAPLDDARTYTVAMNSYLPGVTDLYPAFAEMELVQEWGTCEEALRDLVADRDWEARVAELTGTVTYVEHAQGGGTSTGEPPTKQPAADTDGALAATGDTAFGLATGTAAAGAACLILGVAHRRRRDLGGQGACHEHRDAA